MHSCPNCYQACYCGGDIDDIDTGDVDAEDNCTHCLGDSEEEVEPELEEVSEAVS